MIILLLRDQINICLDRSMKMKYIPFLPGFAVIHCDGVFCQTKPELKIR